MFDKILGYQYNFCSYSVPFGASPANGRFSALSVDSVGRRLGNSVCLHSALVGNIVVLKSSHNITSNDVNKYLKKVQVTHTIK